MNSREQINNAKITILLELYNRDYVDGSNLRPMSRFTFDKYEIFKDVKNKKDLFYISFLELKDLGLVDSTHPVDNNLGVAKPRLTSKGADFLDDNFLEHSFQNFICNGTKKEGKIKDIVVDKTLENVIEKVISYILTSRESLYSIVVQGLNNLPI
jgi:hypothetical protein